MKLHIKRNTKTPIYLPITELPGGLDNPEFIALVKEADADEHLEGYVSRAVSENVVVFIIQGKLIGLNTPRVERGDVWRVGAIYIKPEFRQQGIAKHYIAEYFHDKKAVGLLVPKKH